MNQSMQSIYGVRKTEDVPQGQVPRSLLTNSNRGVIYQQRGIGRQISSWLLEPVKLQGGSTSSSSYAVDIKKSLPKLGMADQAKHQARGGRSSLPKQAGTVLPSISGKLNPYRTSDIKFLKSQYNGKGQRGENPPSGTSPGKRKKGKRTRSPPNKTRLQSKVEIYSTHAAKPAKKPAKLKSSKKIKGQPLPKTFHTSNIATRAKLLTVFLRQPGQNVDLLEETLQFVSQETKHDILMRHAKVLMRNQFYFSSIRIVHMQQDSLGAVLKELMQKISGSMQNSDGWNWNLVDHELFIKQFGDLKILQQYRGVRKKLLGMGENGVIALARVEKEILLKVVSDFMEQLSLPSYQKTVVSELMLEETGGKSRLKKKREPEPEQEEAKAEEEFSLKASKDTNAKPKEEEEEKHAPPAPEESEPPAAEESEPKPADPEPEAVDPEDVQPPAPPAQDVETLKEEKSWQEIEKERLEAEMRAVTEEMEKEESAEAPAAEPEAEPEAEAEGKPAEPQTPEAPSPPPADSTPAPPDAPPEKPEEARAPVEEALAEAEEQAPPPPPPVEETKADVAAPSPPQAVETPPPPPPEKEAEAKAVPVLSERELLEMEREAMQRELQELEAAEEEESADVPPPAEKEETKEEEAKPSVKSVEDEEAKKEEERKKKEEQIRKDKEAMEKEMKALKEKEEAEAKAKAEAEEQAAIKIQSRGRAMLAKKRVDKKKEARKEEQAAIKIQSRGRAMLAKKRVEKKKEARKEEQAAIKIQSRGRAMLAKKKVERKKSEKRAALKKKEAEAKPEPTPEPEPEVKPEPEPTPAPEPAPAPEPEAAEDDIEKLKQQALEEQKRIAKEEGVDFESTLTKPVEDEEDEEIVVPLAASVTAPFEKEIAKAQKAAASPVAPVAVETKEKPVVQESFEDVVAREEEKQEKAEQDIEQAIKRMREEMRQEKERLRKEMEEKRRKLQEARQRKRESATWKKTPVTIVPTESPLKTVKESLKLDEPIKLTVDDIPKAKEPEPKEETGPVPIRPEPVSVVKMPMEPPKPKEPEAPKAGGVVEKASFEKEIHQALQQVQEQLAMQQQQFLQMQFTNMQMATPGMPGIITPGGPVPMNRGGMPMMTPLNENTMATPGMQQLGQTANTNPPTQEEINEYAIYLGMDPVQDKDLLYIAEWALSAPLPEGWTEHVDTSGNEFYFNSMTGVSTYEHPLDGQFREYYRQQKVMAVAK